MPISYTYKIVFIHIPKCAGTTIEKIIGTCSPRELFSHKPINQFGQLKTPQHMTFAELKSNLEIDWTKFYTFSVIRNPYSRFVSEYNYRKEIFTKTKNPAHDPGTFSSFVESLQLEPSQRIFKFDGHLETQSSFLKNENNIIDPSIQLFTIENLTPCWAMLEEKTGIKYANYLWSRKSNDSSPYQTFYTNDTKDLIYNFYKEDFDNFGYSQNL